MVRWEPGAGDRLKQAALDLFEERGYDATTVAEIAERAGLTRRTFFRYFGDKREVLFTDPGPLYSYAASAIITADADLEPAEAMISALAEVGDKLTEFADQPARRRAVIAASPELRGREQQKLTALTAATAGALIERGLSAEQAELTSRIGLAIFSSAWDRWVDQTGSQAFSLILESVVKSVRSMRGLVV